MIDEKTALAEELNEYIKLEKTQEECTGFIDGFEKALEVVKNLNIDFVSKRYAWLKPDGSVSDTWDEKLHKECLTEDDVKYAESTGWKLLIMNVC